MYYMAQFRNAGSLFRENDPLFFPLFAGGAAPPTPERRAGVNPRNAATPKAAQSLPQGIDPDPTSP